MAETTIKILSENEYPLWDEFIRSCPQGNFFYSSEWAVAIAGVFHRQTRFIVALSGDKILAGIVLHEKKSRGKLTAGQVSFFPFNGPLYNFSSREKQHRINARVLEINQAFIQHLNANYYFWSLRINPAPADNRSFRWSDCRFSPEHDYQIVLNPQLDPSADYSQSLRRLIKKSAGLIDIRRFGKIDELVALYQLSYQRHNLLPPVSGSELTAILKAADALGKMKIFTASVGNSIISSRAFLFDEKAIYDLVAGNNPEQEASAEIIDFVLQHYKTDYNLFRFMGADHPEIEQFKRRFGGTIELSMKIERFDSLPLRLMLGIQNFRNRRQRNG